MNTLKQLYVIAVVSASAIVASIGTPSWATSDKSTKLAAPYWLDETIYRPDCPSNDRNRR